MADDIKTEAPATPEVETQKLTMEDTQKAKKKGGLFGDPVFIVE